MINRPNITLLLLGLGLAGSLVSSSFLAVTTLVLAALGGYLIKKDTLAEQGWDTPKELRLIHFAFWFFVLISIISWAIDGFSYAGGKTLITHASFILFWPLAIALTASGIRAKHVFSIFGAVCTVIIVLVIASIPISDRFTSHAGNDVMQLASSKGMASIVSWLVLLAIPFIVFIRQAAPRNPLAVRCLAIAGAVIPGGYFVLGLTEAAFNRSLFLTFYMVSIVAVATALFNELAAAYTRSRKVKVSATVITMNEEDHIAACLASARQVADEIVVLDSGSSDRTVEIAKKYADIVEVTDWPGFGVQKQRALEKASGDWVLSIDADERITAQLAQEINHTLAQPDADAYKLPWAVTLYGTRLDFGRSGRAPLRLFRREGVRFSDALVHEKILIPEGRTTRTLRGRLTHYTHRNFGHALDKSAKYAWLGSQEKFRRGKRTRTLIYPTFRGILTFIQVYFIRGGFLDGAVGYLVAVTYAQGSFNKYAGLWTLSRKTWTLEEPNGKVETVLSDEKPESDLK